MTVLRCGKAEKRVLEYLADRKREARGYTTERGSVKRLRWIGHSPVTALSGTGALPA